MQSLVPVVFSTEKIIVWQKFQYSTPLSTLQIVKVLQIVSISKITRLKRLLVLPESFKLLKCRFCKKLLWYKWNSDQLNTFVLTFFPDQCWSVLIWKKKWGQKCSTGQNFICTKVTSYKIHASSIYDSFDLSCSLEKSESAHCGVYMR